MASAFCSLHLTLCCSRGSPQLQPFQGAPAPNNAVHGLQSLRAALPPSSSTSPPPACHQALPAVMSLLPLFHLFPLSQTFLSLTQACLEMPDDLAVALAGSRQLTTMVTPGAMMLKVCSIHRNMKTHFSSYFTQNRVLN